MAQFLDGTVSSWLWFLLVWSLRWALLIVLAALALFLFRPRRAAKRQLLCLMALVGGFFLPVTPLSANDWPLDLYNIASISRPEASGSHLPTTSRLNIFASRSGKNSIATVDTENSARPGVNGDVAYGADFTANGGLQSRHFAIMLGALCWGCGAFVVLIRALCGVWCLRRLRRDAVAVHGRAASVFRACLAETGSIASIQLAMHPQVRSPLLFGPFRPLILVPPNWAELPELMQQAGLLHELAHVRRRDHWLVPVLRFVQAGFFFHPLVRWLLSRLEQEHELLCDEMVLQAGVDRHTYASLLLAFAGHQGRIAPARLPNETYKSRSAYNIITQTRKTPDVPLKPNRLVGFKFANSARTFLLSSARPTLALYCIARLLKTIFTCKKRNMVEFRINYLMAENFAGWNGG